MSDRVTAERPIPMLLFCPTCGLQHIDAPEPENGWDNPPHKSHLCHGCGRTWRPCDVATNGVAEIETRDSADTPKAKGEIVRTVHYVNVTVHGYDAEHWQAGWQMLVDALDQHLGQFFHDGDEGVEALYVQGIERLGRVLRDVKQYPETGEYCGSVALGEFWRPAQEEPCSRSE